jgi:hypothetical protein
MALCLEGNVRLTGISLTGLLFAFSLLVAPTEEAVRGLRLSEEVVETFLAQKLKHDTHASLDQLPGISVKHFAARRGR